MEVVNGLIEENELEKDPLVNVPKFCAEFDERLNELTEMADTATGAVQASLQETVDRVREIRSVVPAFVKYAKEQWGWSK